MHFLQQISFYRKTQASENVVYLNCLVRDALRDWLGTSCVLCSHKPGKGSDDLIIRSCRVARIDRGMDLTYLCPISGNANRLRTPKLKHAVQGRNGDGDFGRATPICSRAQRISDHSFKPADGGLHQSPTRVPESLLPAHASMLRDVLEMPIALGRSGLRILAQHCR
jgi:hypothetical protein